MFEMSKFCPSCGEELVDNAKFCKSCGKNLDEFQNLEGEGPNVRYAPAVSEKSYTWALILGVVFSLFIPLIGIIIGIYVYTRKDSSKSKLYGGLIIALGVIVWAVSAIFSLLFMGY